MKPQKVFLPILFALSLMMVPNAAYALTITIEGLPAGSGPNSVAPNTSGFAAISPLTFGNFTISQCPGCSSSPRVQWSDTTSVDTLTLTNLRITYNGGTDNTFNISYTQNFSTIPNGTYPNSISGAGTWNTTGDTINVSAFSNGELIGTTPPSLTQSSSSSTSFNAINFRRSENIACSGYGGNCTHSLNTQAAISFNAATNTLDLPGSLDQEVGNDVIPEPTTLLLLGAGLVGLAAFGRKRQLLMK